MKRQPYHIGYPEPRKPAATNHAGSILIGLIALLAIIGILHEAASYTQLLIGSQLCH